jgi:methyl-accepting chemotaxis protein
MRQLLCGINKENLHKVKLERTDLSNEFMYNVYLINTIVEILQKILKESQRISTDVIESSNELSVISRETAVTSLEQNSGIKELLSAMEETDALSKNIASKIGEVSLVAKKTTENIEDGFDILKMNVQKLDEIKAANDITVEGIKTLSRLIHFLNALFPILVTPSGIIKFTKAHPRKEKAPIVSNPFPQLISLNLLQSAKAYSPIQTTLSGIVIFSIPEPAKR